MKTIKKSDLRPVGFVRKAAGFHGGVFIAIDNGSMEDYRHVKFFFLELEGKPVPFAVESMEVKHGDVVVKLEDVNDAEAARKLQTRKVYVEKKQLAQQDTELSWADVVGYTAIDDTEGTLGVIEGVDEYPQQWIARCLFKGREVLIPLNDDTVREIDDEQQTLYLDLPEGLLDLYMV